MSRALYTAATGMIAQQMNVDNIANNLANVNTTGYKKSKLEFQDLLYQQLRLAGATQAEGAQVPVELQIGYGTRPVATQRIFFARHLDPHEQSAGRLYRWRRVSPSYPARWHRILHEGWCPQAVRGGNDRDLRRVLP